jgi:hypothetical protein
MSRFAAIPQALPSIPSFLPQSVQCKLFRAKEHLDELNAETKRYFQSRPARVVRQQEGSPDEFIGKIVADAPVPKRISLIIGDFLQNLRSSLDYLVWELVLAAKNAPDDKNMFPICTTPEAFRGQVSRHRLDGVSPDAVAEIDALQPYHDGADAKWNVLFVVDDLCNINKHRHIVTTSLYGTHAPDDFVTQEINGQLYGNTSFESILKQGTKIGPFPMIDGPYGRGPRVDVPPNLIAFIAFDEGAAQNVEVGHALGIFMGFVIQELNRFDKFFV